MTSTKYVILLLLQDGEKPTDHFYINLENLKENSIRVQLQELTAMGWIEVSKREKTLEGPGRPMHFYRLTPTGQEELEAFKAEIESLQKEMRGMI